MEELDRRIIALLADDGRMSFTDLAKSTGLSVSAVHQRVRRLQKRGIVRGFTARLDLDEIGLPLTAFVSIKPIDPAAPDGTRMRAAFVAAVLIRWAPGETQKLIYETTSLAGNHR